ncbi:MAG TPA: zinc-ribbon domain-containing protein [Thermodesulfobacteriota bacterium]|nr:zinc-ribbon domain-containing protein [Thermodesulfobacteriota bacterium]
MIITCASCLTKFNLDDSRIPPKGVKVRCSRCQHVFYVVPPPETKEEVMEDFESFAKFHEDLIMPGEEPAPVPGLEEERKELLPLQKEEEEPLQKPMPPETEAPEQEEDALLFGEKGLKEKEEMEEVFPEREEAELKPSEPKELVRRRERRGPAPVFAILFVLLLLAFGLYYLWAEVGSGGKLSPYLETPGQKIKQVLNKIWGSEKGGLTISDLTGYEEKVGDISVFIIEGKVSNQSRFTKKQIKVKVLIFDQDKMKLAEKVAICGRVLSRQELKSQPPAFFKGEMVIKPQTEKEGVVSSGKAAPFMVVFRDPLSQAKEFKVEIIEAPNL